MLQIPEYRGLDVQERTRRSMNPKTSYRKLLTMDAEIQTQLLLRLIWCRRLRRGGSRMLNRIVGGSQTGSCRGCQQTC